MGSSKKCFKCGEILPLTEFYKHKEMTDGHLNKCKTCAKRDVLFHRLLNIEKIREYDKRRASGEKRRKAAGLVSRKWRKKDKRIMQCHNKVSRALKVGIIARKRCERCGDEKSLAHHESYDRPLEVNWLCQPCHKLRHKEISLLGINLYTGQEKDQRK